MLTADVEPLGFTDPLRTALEPVTEVAGDVTTLGAEAVTKLSTAPYVFTPAEFVATAWK
jgi:hypothetical protein